MVEISKELEDRLEEKFEKFEKWKLDKRNYRKKFDRERKRIELKKETIGTTLLNLTKREVRGDAFHRVEKENPAIYYFDQKGKKHWIRYRLAEFVCDAYTMIRLGTNLERLDILEYLSYEFLFNKGEDLEIDSLNKILIRSGITDDIINHIKDLQDSKNPTL